MYVIFAAIVLAGVLCAVLLWYSEEGYQGRHIFAGVTGVFGIALTGITMLVYAFAVWGWIASEHKAQIINREYGTHYTQAEVFYASDVIETVRELNRQRYEINGDLVRGKDAKP